MKDNKTHYYWLDWLRFLAAFNVLLGHARATIFVDYYSLAVHWKSAFSYTVFCLISLGNEAVTFFFVLSGFLVGGKTLERICNKTFKPVDYCIDRFSRIMLPLVPSLFLTALIGLLIGRSFEPYTFLGNLASLQGICVPTFGGNQPLWSLSYEVWFYVFIGIVGISVLQKKFSLPLLIAHLTIAVIFSQYLSTVRLYCWLIGVLAYMRRPKAFNISFFLLSILIVTFGVVGVQVEMGALQFIPENIRYLLAGAMPPHLVLAAGFAVFIQQVILCKPRTHWVRRIHEYGVYVAAFSYTLYLTHQPVLDFISVYVLNGEQSEIITSYSIFTYVSVVTVCLTTGYAVYWFFERKTYEFRTFLKKSLKSRASTFFSRIIS